MLKVLIVVVLLAVVTYALVRVIDRRGVQSPVRRPSVRPPERRPFGPDDDDDFLRDLGRRPRPSSGSPGEPDGGS